ncbi:hypothetical protein H5410_021298 [Solanum commersonii]|uniref:Uncharacterized protein n=1 Tax=Solanum commersonii TaxID=4109 RepID=A0A9J5ZAY0_SOLCO|nr:hypothetical protein H5410_021298 [Solanum commersonii]
MPEHHKNISEVWSLTYCASQTSLKFEGWRPASLRAPGKPVLPIRSPPFRTCSSAMYLCFLVAINTLSTFNVLMPVELHLIMMQTQVTRISIQHAVHPVEHSKVIGEPPCIPEDSVIPFRSFALLGCCGVCLNIHFNIIEAS